MDYLASLFTLVRDSQLTDADAVEAYQNLRQQIRNSDSVTDRDRLALAFCELKLGNSDEAWLILSSLSRSTDDIVRFSSRSLMQGEAIDPREFTTENALAEWFWNFCPGFRTEIETLAEVLARLPAMSVSVALAELYLFIRTADAYADTAKSKLEEDSRKTALVLSNALRFLEVKRATRPITVPMQLQKLLDIGGLDAEERARFQARIDRSDEWH